MPTPVDAYLQAHVADLTALLRRLVRIPTVNPPGEHYDEITRLLADELSRAGLRVRRPRVPVALARACLPREQCDRPRWNVIGRLRSGCLGAKTLHFNAHYDVVPVSGKWRHGSPYSGVEERGWIYGRGTADMKGAIASLILALRAVQAVGAPRAVDVEVSFTADEETDSALGAAWLVEHGGVRPDYALVLEGGDGPMVCCGHNGVVWLEVTVHGRAAHGSTPEKGVNALEHAARLVLALRDRYAAELARREFMAPNGEVRRPTLNLGGVFSSGEGGKINTVPALARFSVDRRVLPTERVEDAERELRAFIVAAVREIPGCRVSMAKVSENHPCFASPDHGFARAVAAQVRRVRRCKPVFGCSTGFNDMHFFAHYLGVPTLGYGPGGENYHGLDERAAVKDLVAAARVYAGLITDGI